MDGRETGRKDSADVHLLEGEKWSKAAAQIRKPSPSDGKVLLPNYGINSKSSSKLGRMM